MRSWIRSRAVTSPAQRGKLVAVLGCAAAAAAWLAPSSASASPPNPNVPAGHIAGIVPPHGAGHSSGSTASGSNLGYHGGPVMHTNQVYLIFWEPAGFTVANGYESAVGSFITNVGAASGATTNVYAVDTQYYDGSGPIQYNVSLGGSYIDTSSLPSPAGCTDKYTRGACVSDAQIQAEINRVAALNGWHETSTNFFVMLTAKGIGSCSGSSCAFTQYCAYHGASGSLFYANMPYADTVPAACDSGQSPNGNVAADSEVSILSHEHNETITDQQLNAWFDRRGAEIGDKCAWNFGSASGTSGAEYNQTINGVHYYLQQEWSNRVSGCALTN